MTQHAKRIRIAGSCGITSDRPLPDYFNDLNAMHEAEKLLTKDQMTTMSQYLHRRLGMLWGFATASQRAEAFGLTLNLWTAND